MILRNDTTDNYTSYSIIFKDVVKTVLYCDFSFTHTHTHLHRVSLTLQTGHCRVNGGSVEADMYEVGVNFDQHRIITLEGVVGVFPYSSEQLLTQRRKKVGKNRMEREENPIV